MCRQQRRLSTCEYVVVVVIADDAAVVVIVALNAVLQFDPGSVQTLIFVDVAVINLKNEIQVESVKTITNYLEQK